MALFSLNNVKLSGVSACVPKQVASNYELSLLSEKEQELLVKTTGIEHRRIAAPGVITSDLCIESSLVLMNDLEWSPSDIDVLIFITQTPDFITPATSNIIQDKLGLSTSCIALDINLGCSGYVYGLSVAGSLLQTLTRGKALLLVGDVSTACISSNDKSTVPIFSDAGSATALEFDEGAETMYFNLQGDGSGYQSIIIPDGGYRNPFKSTSLEDEEISKGIVRNKTHLILNGIDIYNFSVSKVPENVRELLKFSSLTTQDVDAFVFHQANKLINESIRKKLDLPAEKVPSSLSEFGNTSSATIPVTMVTQLNEALKNNQLNLVLSGFGVGLSWSSVLLPTNKIACPPLVEI